MAAKAYINKFKDVQQALLNYIDNDSDEEFMQLVELISTSKINENKKELKSFLQLIYSFANNHHRTSNFFKKIDQILLHYLSNIKQILTANELVKLFYNCKIIILFFIDQKILAIKDLPQTPSFLSYFYPEIEESLKEDEKQQYLKIFEDNGIQYDRCTFIKDRKTGENESYICKLIREDSVQEFISYVNRNNLSLTTIIPSSLFETNEYLKNKKCEIIEYSAFYGSIQIFNYLRLNKVKMRASLWPFSIHGNNPEMIHLLEENVSEYNENKKQDYTNMNIRQHDRYLIMKRDRAVKSMKNLNYLVKSLIESIKCNHNEIADYIRNKIIELTHVDIKNKRVMDNFILKKNDFLTDFLSVTDKDFQFFMENLNVIDDAKEVKEEVSNIGKVDEAIADSIFGSYNYLCFPENFFNNKSMVYFCEYDYLFLVEFILGSKKLNIDDKTI